VFQNSGFIYEEHEELVYVESCKTIAKPQRRADLPTVEIRKNGHCRHDRVSDNNINAPDESYKAAQASCNDGRSFKKSFALTVLHSNTP